LILIKAQTVLMGDIGVVKNVIERNQKPKPQEILRKTETQRDMRKHQRKLKQEQRREIIGVLPKSTNARY
jgi:hypothetical protein